MYYVYFWTLSPTCYYSSRDVNIRRFASCNLNFISLLLRGMKVVCHLLTTADYAVCGLLPSEQHITSKQAPNHHDTVAPSIAQPYTQLCYDSIQKRK